MNEAPKVKKTSHITYKDYKKRVGKRNNQGMIIFVSAFFMMLLIFLGIAKQMSPDVDVSIGDSEMSREEMVKSSVDDRLKLIHMEDNSFDSGDETFSPELEEKVTLPDKARDDETTDNSDDWADLSAANKKAEDEAKKKAAPIVDKTTQSELDETMKHHQEIIKNLNNMKPAQPIPVTGAQNTMPGSVALNKPATHLQPAAKVPVPAPTASAAKTISAKVVVGNYATMEQAQVAKGIISEAGLNIDPFVRNIGGTYTIQTGSFTSKEKAQAAANDLLRNNFPARVIIEQ